MKVKIIINVLKKIENCEKCLNNGNKCTKCENNYYFINENYNLCINENTFEEYNYYKKMT